MKGNLVIPYTVLIVGLEDFQDYYERNFLTAIRDFDKTTFTMLDKEMAYDWIITNAINILVQGKGAKVIGHYRHDIFICLYTYFQRWIEEFITIVFRQNRVEIQQGDIIKVMVSDRALFLSRGIYRE